jgi:FkbM family methyltransferase
MSTLENKIYDKYIKTNDVVYDIGAHIGEMSISFIRRGASKVIAFEPSIFNFNDLVANTREYSNIYCHNIALSNKAYECNTKFKDCAETRLRVEKNTQQHIKYAITEDYINQNNLDLPDFIKMDIEGMESIVLTTFNFLFEGKRPIIHVEVHASAKNNPEDYENNPHWKWPDEGGFNFNLLKNFNYLIVENLENIKDINSDYNPFENQHSHIVLVPKEKM